MNREPQMRFPVIHFIPPYRIAYDQCPAPSVTLCRELFLELGTGYTDCKSWQHIWIQPSGLAIPEKLLNMAEKKPQTFANHGRNDPAFHFFLVPIFAIAWVMSIVHFVVHFTRDDLREHIHSFLLILLATAFLVLVFKIRLYALKVQDRVIRLEERLRLAMLLNEPWKSRIPELTEGQLIALRFAPDAEVQLIVESALRENLSRKEIKKLVQNWRPDYWRI